MTQSCRRIGADEEQLEFSGQILHAQTDEQPEQPWCTDANSCQNEHKKADAEFGKLDTFVFVPVHNDSSTDCRWGQYIIVFSEIQVFFIVYQYIFILVRFFDVFPARYTGAQRLKNSFRRSVFHTAAAVC